MYRSEQQAVARTRTLKTVRDRLTHAREGGRVGKEQRRSVLLGTGETQAVLVIQLDGIVAVTRAKEAAFSRSTDDADDHRVRPATKALAGTL